MLAFHYQVTYLLICIQQALYLISFPAYYTTSSLLMEFFCVSFIAFHLSLQKNIQNSGFLKRFPVKYNMVLFAYFKRKDLIQHGII